MSASQNTSNLNGIAVIGMACSFPGASNIDEYWKNLCEGVESITFFSPDDLDKRIPDNLQKNPKYIHARGILDDVEMFAADFFGINSLEAKVMDPQHRKFLELAWQALEHSGYDSNSYPGLIGVYAGAGVNCYYKNHVLYHSDLIDSIGETQILLANEKDYLTTRISHKLNLKGPSVSVNTACSTSLVAVSFACDGLLNYQCDMALAGGVSITLPQNSGYLFREVNIFSKDGHCRPFDSQSSGTVSSNGLGIVILKRLEDAIEDGDRIYSVIRGAAVNNDGSEKMSFMAPSINGQAEAISMALANADLEPEDITYIEAHGTATKIGDPIEIEALTKVFQAETDKKSFCSIGSVKGNFGHLDAAAGVAGLMKAILSVYHAKLPPSLHYEKPNPNIDFTNSPFYVNDKLTDWPNLGGLRRAGVSSFGIGGTNAHVIIEEPPKISDSGASRPFQLFLLSAKTRSALDTACLNLKSYFDAHPNINLADAAYTFQTGRRRFKHRRMLVVTNMQETLMGLEKYDVHPVKTRHIESENPEVVFMFPGQGVQYVNMGLSLYKYEAVFRKAMDACAETLKPSLQLDIRNIIYPEDDGIEEANEKLNQTCFAQPAIFAIEYALAKLWIHWGVFPTAMIGHSIGEFVAACLSGVFTLKDALSIVSIRGKLMQDLPLGSMLTLNKPVDEVNQWLPEALSIASVNAPDFCVISGPTDSVEEFRLKLNEKGVKNQILNTSHAFHSQMMDPVVTPFLKQLEKIELSEPKIPFVSTATGNWITGEEATNPEYWAHHLRTTVLFSDSIKKIWEKKERVLLEVGPRMTTGFLARQHITDASNQTVVSTLGDKNKEYYYVLNAIGILFLSGIDIDWEAFYQNETRHKLPLPGYPFEKKRYWLDAPIQNENKQTEILEYSFESARFFGEAQSKQSIEELQDENDDKSSSKFNGQDDGDTTAEKRRATFYSSTERALIKIWRSILPEIEHIDINDDFFDLGGHSLLAVQLFSDIKKLTDVDLPLSSLFDAPTIKQMAGLLDGHSTPKLEKLRDESQIISKVRPKKPKIVSISKSTKSKWSYLIPIQSKGNTPPLFCVHHVGGSILGYQIFVTYLGKKQPIYGLQARGFNGKERPISDIKTMAENYIKEMRLVQPTGPYYLCGHSMGGAVAYELAIQLKQMGEKIAFLALFDTYHPKHLELTRGPSGSVTQHMEVINRLKIKKKLGYIVSKLINKTLNMIKTAVCLTLYNFKHPLPYTLKDYYVSKTHQYAYLNYDPGVFEGDLTFFSCSLNDSDSDLLRGWGNSVIGEIKLIEIPSNHYEILEKIELAEKLKEYLAEAQGK